MPGKKQNQAKQANQAKQVRAPSQSVRSADPHSASASRSTSPATQVGRREPIPSVVNAFEEPLSDSLPHVTFGSLGARGSPAPAPAPAVQPVVQPVVQSVPVVQQPLLPSDVAGEIVRLVRETVQEALQAQAHQQAHQQAHHQAHGGHQHEPAVASASSSVTMPKYLRLKEKLKAMEEKLKATAQCCSCKTPAACSTGLCGCRNTRRSACGPECGCQKNAQNGCFNEYTREEMLKKYRKIPRGGIFLKEVEDECSPLPSSDDEDYDDVQDIDE